MDWDLKYKCRIISLLESRTAVWTLPQFILWCFPTEELLEIVDGNMREVEEDSVSQIIMGIWNV